MTSFAAAVRTMRPYWILIAVAIAAILTFPVALVVFVPAPLTSQEKQAPRVVVSVATNNVTYAPGESVIITVRVTNAGNGIAYVEFASTCQVSYSILAGNGSLVYDHRTHTGCAWMLTNWTLRPGDTRVFTFTWDQTTDAGIPVETFRTYRIAGTLLSMKPVPGSSVEGTIFVMRGTAEPNLAFTALTDRTVYRLGETANVSVILTNIGLEPVVMHFANPCFTQFVVLGEIRLAVYNSSKWWGCVQVIADVVLAPGASLSHVFAWNMTTDAGGPLTAGQQYEVVPSFIWPYASTYQRYVSRTNVATFIVAAFTV
jgi:hypothetical protein